MRIKTFGEALQEATDQSMKKDDSVFIIGEGVPDPKGLFGTTSNLLEKYGEDRVMEMPVSENGMTGVCIGASIMGLKPILVHARLDFSLLSLDQIINNASKWHYMYGGNQSVPMVIRMIIGRGWGQGAQHSQNLQSLFAHIPGLKVIMPSTAYDAKGLLAAAIEDKNPVIFLEHRWLYGVKDDVPEKYYTVPIGEPAKLVEGDEITIVAISYMNIEARKALKAMNISADLIDIRTLRPLNDEMIIESVKKTGRLLVLDTGWPTAGFSAEIISIVSEKAFDSLKEAPKRITLPDIPTPSTPGLTKYHYPRHTEIIKEVSQMLGRSKDETDKILKAQKSDLPHDVPDKNFTGPF